MRGMKGTLFLILVFISTTQGINSKKGLKRPVEEEEVHYPPVVNRLFHTAASTAVFEDPRLPEPKMVFNYFLGLAETPRASGHWELIVPKLVEWGHALGLEAFSDSLHNVIIRKPASVGCEGWPSVCIQGHWDIVAVKLDSTDLDFRTDPLRVLIAPSPDESKGKWILKADGTSLGADDGIGVAGGLAIMADNSLKHGPLELLITCDEETDMTGAEFLAPNTLRSKYLINVDSGSTSSICIGCAGGEEDYIEVPLVRGTVEGVRVQIDIAGLRGGHSAGQINAGRACGFKLLGELIDVASNESGVRDAISLQRFEGGRQVNVINFQANSTVIVPAEKKAAFLASLHKEALKLQTEWKTNEPGMDFKIIADDGEGSSYISYDAPSSRKALDLIHAVPHGVLRFSPDVPGTVETSINFYLVRLYSDNEFDSGIGLEFFYRSSDDAQRPYVNELLGSLARLSGGSLNGVLHPFPAWRPDTSSYLLAVGKQVYRDQNGGKEADIYATHGGLEVGLLFGSHPHLQAIAIGPNTMGAHSVDEAIFIDSIGQFYRFLTEVLARLDA